MLVVVGKVANGSHSLQQQQQQPGPEAMWAPASALLLGLMHPVRNSLHPAGELSRPCWYTTSTLTCPVCAVCVLCCVLLVPFVRRSCALLCSAVPCCALCVPSVCSAVRRWRQLSEPADQVVWVDLLTKVRGAHTHWGYRSAASLCSADNKQYKQCIETMWGRGGLCARELHRQATHSGIGTW